MRLGILCLLCFIVILVKCNEDILVFDLFEGHEEDAPVKQNPVIKEVKQGVNIILVVINWGGSLDTRVEQSLWKAATHPNIVAQMTVQISSAHRAKNSALDQSIAALEQQLKQAEDPTTTDVFTHVLLVNQDITFTIEDIDKLVESEKEFIGGIAPSRSRSNTIYPAFIPSANKQVLGLQNPTPHNFFDFVLQQHEPISVHAMSADFLLLKLSALKQIGKVFGSRKEWFWMSEETPLWAIGNCYELIDNPVKKLDSKESLTSFETQKYGNFLQSQRYSVTEEDICFCKNVKRFGYQLFIHPDVNVKSVRTMDISFHGSLDSLSIESRKVAEPILVEDRMALVKAGRQLAMDKPSMNAQVILATAVWSSNVSNFIIFFCSIDFF